IAQLCCKLKNSKEEAITAQDFELAAKLRDDEKKASEEYEESKSSWESSRDNGNICITDADVAKTLSDQTGIPIGVGENSESASLLRLEEILKERVVGQDEAIKNIAHAVRRGRAGISDPQKPIGSFIFLGPTGVGKTELAEALAEAVYGNEASLIRLDMSEYMEKHSVSKLIGSPPGYVGYDEGGLLTERVRRRPYSLVLFDEIEKAHPDIFNILLQTLDDGILTDSTGRAVNFKNTIIIMTSNLGASSERKGTLGFSEHRNDEEVSAQKALRSTFRPEFLNRVDDVIMFKKLQESDLLKITQIQLKRLVKRCAARGIDLIFEPEAVELIAKSGADERYGARPIRRAITRLVEDPLAALILNREFTSEDRISAYAVGDKIEFQKK
ncbi:MAG: AAA family ATPase, partial [Ruminococcaceae bacterium]|nr:AAA family ATPase [Oscillospiraceae bacterium]